MHPMRRKPTTRLRLWGSCLPLVVLSSTLLLSSLQSSAVFPRVIVVVSAAAADEDIILIRCSIGFGGHGGGPAAAAVVNIPPAHINDGYCDCPLTGEDEPLTSACAGNEYWSGRTPQPQEGGDDDDDDNSDDDDNKKFWFRCPQQPKLLVPPSKLNDGICDCCDGSDETASGGAVCEDICEEVLAEERAERERLVRTYGAGSRKRAAEVAALAQLKVDVKADVERREADLDELEGQWTANRDQIDASKLKRLGSRLDRASALSVALATVLPTKTPPEEDEIVDSESISGLKGMLEPLTVDELTWFIVHACQIAGEMVTLTPQSERGGGKTCAPLRLAGLDAGITWKPETYELARLLVPLDAASRQQQPPDQQQSEYEMRLAAILEHNLRNDRKIWDESAAGNNKNKKHKGKGGMRRRLSEDSEDYENHGHDDYKSHGHGDGDEHEDYGDDDHYGGTDDYYPDEHDEDIHEDHEEDDTDGGGNIEEDDEAEDDDEEIGSNRFRHRRHRGEEGNDGEAVSDDAGSRRGELETLIRERTFSKARVSLLDRSSALIERIEEATSAAAEEEKEDIADDKEEGESEEEEEEASEEETDAAREEAREESENAETGAEETTWIRNKLERLEKAVTRGVDYAVSGKVLIDAVEAWPYESENERREDLYRLAIGTLNHGKLSTLHVWQIYQSILPELSVSDGGPSGSDETCRSPWAGSCPPRIVERSVGNTKVTIPPREIAKAGESFCETQYEESAVEAACAAGSQLQDDGIIIPSDIPDGFMGYYEVRPREEGDLLEVVLAPLGFDYDAASNEELDGLLEEESRIEGEMKNIEKEVHDLKDSIGSDKPDKFGPDGELHALRDQCFAVDAGKYTYELCMFKSAAQKDLGAKGGTDLGKWAGAEAKSETGERVWKWERGAKCWNGPARSATAYVTCGEETRVLSAEEPEVCTYVMRMESYVACDESFGTHHGLL